MGFRIALGRSLGYLYSLFPTRDRKVAELQMRMCLGADYNAQNIKRMFSSLGQSVMECFDLDYYLNDVEKHIDCPTWKVATDVKNGTKPIIVLSAHTGNWDLLAGYTIARGIKVSTIARRARNKYLQVLLEKIRSLYGIDTIWKEDKNSTRLIARCFKSNGVLAALIDQDISVDSEYVNFFGMPAKYPAGLIALAKKSNSHIIAAFIFRERNGRYKVYLHNIDNSKEVKEILVEYSELLENYIRMYPDQWVWFHKRWRSIEGGKKYSGGEYVRFLENYEKENTKTA